MRTVRLLGAIFATLTIGLLLAPATDAQPPLRLPGYVTDDAGALSASDRAEVNSAIDKLYADRHIRLWVVYVDDFSGLSAMNWAQGTLHSSDFGDYDALLAVGTTARSYAFLVPKGVRGVTETQVDDLRHNQIEPALRDGKWGRAAVAAADGLNTNPSRTGRVAMVAVLSGVVAAMVALVLVMRYRTRRRRAAELAAARQLDPTDANALAAVSLRALDDLSRSMVVEVDNAVRTSSNELSLAIGEFGEERTAPFTSAVNNAKAALSQAFTVRQQLDDTTPETPAQRRELLTRVIVSAAQADRELESQAEAFEALRDLVINASSHLAALTRQVVELTARIGPAEQQLAELHKQFDPAALTSVSGNVATAKERLAFADRNISTAGALVDKPMTGQQTPLVDAVRATESALGQVRALLDAVDSAASDIRHALDGLPALVANTQTGIQRANQQLHNSKSAHRSTLVAARDAAAAAVDSCRGVGSVDPLGTFTRLTKAEADLNQQSAALAEEQADADRLQRSLEQALFTAQARVLGVSEYIDTRRGGVGPDARTRLAEAKRHLQAAQDKKPTNPTEAIAHANAASTLAAQAQALANVDVQSAQRAYSGRGGGDSGAALGGIIIGDILSSGMRGGFGGWSPASFGGRSSSPRTGSGGGFLGGGGRF